MENVKGWGTSVPFLLNKLVDWYLRLGFFVLFIGPIWGGWTWIFLLLLVILGVWRRGQFHEATGGKCPKHNIPWTWSSYYGNDYCKKCWREYYMARDAEAKAYHRKHYK